MDSEDADIRRDFFVLQDMDMPFANILCRYFRHGVGLRDFSIAELS